MNTLSLDAVLDELVAELAEQRRRDAAYVALARAILTHDAFQVEQRDATAA
jgi:hypothetical protein